MPVPDSPADRSGLPDSFTPAHERAVDRIVSVFDGADAILLETHKAQDITHANRG